MASLTMYHHTLSTPVPALRWTGKASDLKLRKSDSRTYFLDKMQEKLNRRMDMNEEKDRRIR